MNPTAVELRLPAQPQMMLVVRLTTAGVLARSGLTIEAMDDVKMAAEEACNCLIRSCGCPALRIAYQVEGEDFVFSAQAEGCAGEDVHCPGISDDEVGVMRCVLLSMIDQVELSFDGGCLRGMTLRKRLPR